MTLEQLARLPTSAMSEPMLLAGYNGAAAEARECACGGVIVATSPAPATIMAAVAGHNQSLAHVLWRQRRECR